MLKNVHFEYGNSVGPDENCDFKRCKLTTFSTEQPEKKNQPSESKCLKLRLKCNRMPDVVYTGLPIGREGASIDVVLVDGLTGDVVKSGSEASAEVEILVLGKGFNKNDTDNWTSKEFEANILEGRQGKTSLLARTRVNLIEGCGSLNNIFFSHTRHPLPKTEVRLGARLIRGLGSSDPVRIREAVSDPFTVKDRRGKMLSVSKNHYQLSWADEVSRLKNIGKDGPSHDNLRKERIQNVGDFLTMLLEDPHKLKDILAKTMSPEKLETTINHAMTCDRAMRKHLRSSPISEQNPGLVFKNVEEEMDAFSQTKHDAAEAVSNIHKIIDPMDAFDEPCHMIGLESMTGAFFEDEHLWRHVDTHTIIRAFGDNEHQQFLDPFDPFQSTVFCSPADLHNVLHGLLEREVPLDKAQTHRGWKLLFSILRWLSAVRRIVARKQLVRGIKRYRQEQMFSPQALNTANASVA